MGGELGCTGKEANHTGMAAEAQLGFSEVWHGGHPAGSWERLSFLNLQCHLPPFEHVLWVSAIWWGKNEQNLSSVLFTSKQK